MLFLISALILIGFLFPLSYAQQQIGSLYNPATNPIKHIVVIMQENRSFDNYFGTYPGANGIPKGTACMPLSPGHSTMGCVKPFLSTSAVSGDIPHGYQSSIAAYDNGKMDGFMVAENENPKTMSYYDNKTIPYYWNLAKHYVLVVKKKLLNKAKENNCFNVIGGIIAYAKDESITLIVVETRGVGEFKRLFLGSFWCCYISTSSYFSYSSEDTIF